jgi:hypothetical protein
MKKKKLKTQKIVETATKRTELEEQQMKNAEKVDFQFYASLWCKHNVVQATCTSFFLRYLLLNTALCTC